MRSSKGGTVGCEIIVLSLSLSVSFGLCETLFHEGASFGVLVDEDAVSVVADGSSASCARACEEIEDGITWAAVDSDDALKDS